MTLEQLAVQMAEGFAQQGKEIQTHGNQLHDLTQSVALIVKHMATKEETAAGFTEVRSNFVRVGAQLLSIESELKTINSRLDALEEKVGNLMGFNTEIVDHGGRLDTIEQHLGLDKKIAA